MMQTRSYNSSATNSNSQGANAISSSTLNRKTKIFLTDYPYKKDIENRLFLSDLSLFEVQVLQEILNNSIKIPISDLCSALDCDSEQLTPILDKFSRTGLLMRQTDSIFVDKELRKYYEFHIEKFDDDFEPNIEFMLGLLNKVPISLLPTWYNISKTSDNIFASLIEKYFSTPKIYEKHLADLLFTDPALNAIVRDLFSSKELKISTDDLRKKYSLSKEKLEELIMQLEFHLVLCLSYNKQNGKWKGVITPLHEWRELLLFQEKTKPQAIATTKKEAIEKSHPVEDFGFLLDLQEFLKKVKEGKLKPTDASKDKDIVKACQQLGFIECTQGKIKPKNSPDSYLSMSLPDQSMYLYRQLLSDIIKNSEYSFETIEKSFREVERSLKRILTGGWIFFEDYMQGLISPIGRAEPVTLKKSGKKWRYMLPTYTDEEKTFVEMMIFGPLFQSGVTTTGTFKGKKCFCITAYGKVALGD